jgi:hypothetical protein
MCQIKKYKYNYVMLGIAYWTIVIPSFFIQYFESLLLMIHNKHFSYNW